MMKLPFSRKQKDGDAHRPCVAFAEYCREEIERLRDSGDSFAEDEFQAAVDLALTRLRAFEEEEKT